MAAILVVIFFVAYIKYMDYRTDQKVDNYDLRKVDHDKMCQDQYMNNLSERKVQQNMVSGKYDKK